MDSISPLQLFTITANNNLTPILTTFSDYLQQQPESLTYCFKTSNEEQQQNCCSTLSQQMIGGLLPVPTKQILNENLELLEELEDRVILNSSRSFDINTSVNFRSRLFLYLQNFLSFRFLVFNFNYYKTFFSQTTRLE